MTARRRSVSAVCLVVGVWLAAGALWVSRSGPVSSVQAPGQSVQISTQPSVRVADTFITKSYVASRKSVSVAADAGTLEIPALGVKAPIAAVHLDQGVFAVPNNVHEVGWLVGTARSDSVIGSSVIGGHVADRRDSPGAMWPLRDARIGQRVLWRSPSGQVQQFVVEKLAQYPRASGLPASIYTTTGPHVLTLVTCANRKALPGGGFHYEDNLVVTARALDVRSPLAPDQ